MLSPEQRLTDIRDLIKEKLYFVIHAPRQSGKTTLIRTLARKLTTEGKYAALAVSVESFTGSHVDTMIPRLVADIADKANDQLPVELLPPSGAETLGSPNTVLFQMLNKWSRSCPLPVVIFFDEIDSLAAPVLISILRQIRDGYTSRPAPFPQSIALVGMRDIRDYKIQARGKDQSMGTSSPFNVKARSLFLRNFYCEEVAELLAQHTDETQQTFDDDAVTEIYEQTRGQPWLVNALAAQIATDYDALVKNRKIAITRDHVLQAREILIERRDTHLDSLVHRLGEDRVKRVIQPILIGKTSFDAAFNDDFSYVRDLGLVENRNGTVCISNPIYQEIIPRVLSFHIQAGIALTPAWFLKKDGTLDMIKLIEGFLEFWREHGEVLLQGMPYHEAAPHLVFMAYLQRVVNHGGRIDREFAIGTGRADLVTIVGGKKDIIELKLVRRYKSFERGLDQVARYARDLGRKNGYLILFDTQSTTPWDQRGSVEEVPHKGVDVFVVRA